MRCFCTNVRADTILDPVHGQRHHRQFVGIEQDPIYFDYACKRIAKAWRVM